MKKIFVMCLIFSSFILLGCNSMGKMPLNNSADIDIQSIEKEGQALGVEKIKEIVLEKSGGGKIIEIEYDGSGQLKKYEGNIIKDNIKYDFEVDATTGRVIEWKEEYSPSDSLAFERPANSKVFIGTEKAKEIVLNRLSGGVIIKIEYDGDDYFEKYEGEAIKDKVKYDFEINAVTGEIVKWEIDRD